ncbi:helix-turn-helix domain-containing protein [Fibrobacter sp.]
MNLQKYLDRTNMTRSALAGTLGVDVSAVTNWCNGNNTPKYSMCVQLLKMGVLIEELFDEEVSAIAEKQFFSGKSKVSDFSNEECAEIVQRGMLAIMSK